MHETGAPIEIDEALTRDGVPPTGLDGSRLVELTLARAGPCELRQRAIERLMILDSPPEERFDRLTRLAQLVLDVPFATITLVDHDRVWRKSCAGMSVSEIPRSES